MAMIATAAGGCSDSHSETNADHDHNRQGVHEVELVHTHGGDYPIKVVATTGMVADIVEHVGGKHVAVTQLLGADIDPHQHKVVPADTEACANADVIFYSGLHLEGKMGELFARMAAVKPAFAVTQYIAKDSLLSSEGADDPHVWFDVSLWRQTIPLVCDVLAKFDAPHADEYRRNSAEYEKVLEKLHEECLARLASIPKSQRVMITAHDAFRYFGRAYDIEVHGIQGISTESEAGVSEVNRLINMIVSRKIKAVFVETSVPDQNVSSLLEGAKRKGHDVKIGGRLFSDAMGQKGTDEGTYPGMVRKNVATLVEALK